ncbi:MAG TPA: hypothetical protein DHW63_04070, partial [Hyphomonadaceae bacterium]|nr:hypothetical protein [Hyphomonadaceae bacterium]
MSGFPLIGHGAFVAEGRGPAAVVKPECGMVSGARAKACTQALRGRLAFGFPPTASSCPQAIRAFGFADGPMSETEVAETFDGETSEAAGRYAQAAFDLAKETKALDAVEQDFQKLAAAWKESADLRSAARSPLIGPEEKAAALSAVAQKLGMSDLGRKIVGAAAQNRRAAEL